jgi:hypothetical protein
MTRKDDRRIDPIREYTEWAEHRYDPGHYLGGTLEPHLRKNALGPRARRNAGWFLAVIALMTSAGALLSWSTQGGLERLATVSIAALTCAAAWKMFRR